MKRAELTREYIPLDSPKDKYTKTVENVCYFIQEHLDEDVNLEHLSRVVSVSPFHLHRIFTRIKGETLKSYVRRLRLERSAYELKISDKPILDLALESGYQTHETFTRAFRQRFGVNPSDFRRMYHLSNESKKRVKIPDWINLDTIRTMILDDMQMAYLRVTGSYVECPSPQDVNSPWQILNKALRLRQVALERPRYVGICHDDPRITDDDDVRFDAGIIMSNEYRGDDFIRVGRIKAGPYVVAHHVGTVQQLYESYEYLLNEWIGHTPYRLRNDSPFEIYHNIYETDKGGIDIYIPIIMS